MILTLDLETSGETTFGRFCNPLDPRNTITAAAYKYSNRDAYVNYNVDGLDVNHVLSEEVLKDVKVIVGQNIKFDLLYLWGSRALQQWIIDGGQVWDTLTVEYLLSGQNRENRDLDSLAVKYGGTVKDDRIKEMYAAGLQSKDIPEDMLCEYAKYDVINTELVFRAQIERAIKYDIMPTIKLYMAHYLAVIEMEYNGLSIDVPTALEMSSEIETELARIQNTAIKMLNWPKEIEFNIGSLDHLSVAFFGGELPYIGKENALDEEGNEIIFKTGAKKGQIKTRNVKLQMSISGSDRAYPTFEKNKKGYYNTDDANLEKFLKYSKSTKLHRLVELVQKYRQKSKLLYTYLYSEKTIKGKTKTTGMVSLVMPHTGCVHTNFKTAQTTTGRLSSSSPNVQNLPEEVVKLVKASSQDSTLIEIDYSQQEIVIVAYLSQDPILMREVSEGIDLYLANAYFIYDKPIANVTKEERKNIKIMMLALLYGQHHTGMAARTGVSESECEAFIEAFYDKYQRVHDWHKKLLADVERNQEPTTKMLYIKDKETGLFFTQDGEWQAKSYINHIHKRYVHFDKAVQTKKGVFRYWPSTDIKNYPVQGTAAIVTGGGVANLYKYLAKNKNKAKLINEVHDSVLIEAKDEYLDEVVRESVKILRDVNNMFLYYYKREFNLPINVEVHVGKTWYEAKKAEPYDIGGIL